MMAEVETRALAELAVPAATGSHVLETAWMTGTPEHATGVVSDVATGLRLLQQMSSTQDRDVQLTDAAKPAPSKEGLGASSWLSWMIKFPELRSRQCERLLQREHAARRKIADDYNVSAGTFALHHRSVTALQKAIAARSSDHHNMNPIREPPAPAVARVRKDQQAATAAAASQRIVLPPIVESSCSSDLATPAVFASAFTSAVLNQSPTVDISNLGVTHVELQTLVSRLISNADTLELLILDGNRLTDIACPDIASLILHATKLRVLSLRFNQITDVGVSHLITAAARSPSLEVMDMAGTLVSTRYRSHILRVLAAPRTTLGLSNVRRTGVMTSVDDDMPLVTMRVVAPPPPLTGHLAPVRISGSGVRGPAVPPYRPMKVEIVRLDNREELKKQLMTDEDMVGMLPTPRPS
jgi:hypothetical protein